MLQSDSLSPAHFNVVFGIGLLENMCVQYGCHSRNPGRLPGHAIKTSGKEVEGMSLRIR